MTTKIFHEQCSSLVDGELDESECGIVLDKISKDNELKSRLHRYFLIRDAIRTNLPTAVRPDFCHCVMTALESEPTILSPTTKVTSHSPHTKRFISLAIAASVATVAVFTFQTTSNFEQNDQVAQMPESSEFIRMNKSPSAKPNISTVIAPTTHSNQNSAAVPKVLVSQPTASKSMPQGATFDPKIHNYIVNHNQHLSSSRLQGAMPYARIVVTKTVKPEASTR